MQKHLKSKGALTPQVCLNGVIPSILVRESASLTLSILTESASQPFC